MNLPNLKLGIQDSFIDNHILNQKPTDISHAVTKNVNSENFKDLIPRKEQGMNNDDPDFIESVV